MTSGGAAERTSSARSSRPRKSGTRTSTVVRDVAERTAARAEVPQNHEGRGALAEALGDVRAGRFLADRVQFLLPEDPLDGVELRAGAGRTDANPIRLGEPFLAG